MCSDPAQRQQRPQRLRARTGSRCLSAPAVQDGILDDDELNLFQTKCFAAPLQSHELSGIKTVVADKMPEVQPCSFAWCTEYSTHIVCNQAARTLGCSCKHQTHSQSSIL